MKLLSKLLNRWFEKIPRPVLGYPSEGIKYPAIYDFNEHEMQRHYLELLLIRYWFKNKNANGIFEFEPINIRKDYVSPYFIDAIKYDMSPKNECSLNVLISTATDDKLFLRPNSEEDMPFIDAPCFRTEELMWLIRRLNELVGPSLWYTTEHKEK